MAIIWTNLSVGVESIDAQHKSLFEKVNDLLKREKTRGQRDNR